MEQPTNLEKHNHLVMLAIVGIVFIIIGFVTSGIETSEFIKMAVEMLPAMLIVGGLFMLFIYVMAEMAK